MDLRPLLVSRIANVVPGLLLAALGVGYWLVQRTDLALTTAVLGAVVGGWLGVRGYRQGVRCGEEAIEVRGLLRSRRIPVERIVAITNFPAVSWQTESGRKRWSPIIAFAELDDLIEPIRRHNEAAVGKLQEWDQRRRGVLEPKHQPARSRRTRPRQGGLTRTP
jgi:hypothetical protein